MVTYALCDQDGFIISVRREDTMPKEEEIKLYLPDNGFYIDLTGKESFDTMDLIDITDGYKADSKKKKLVKIKE